MRNFVLFLSLLAFTFIGCKKKSGCDFPDIKITAPQHELTALQDSLAKYGINNTSQHPSGFNYRIIDKGSGNSVTNLCTTISAKYKGTFFNGNVFDQSINTPISLMLGQMITGWQKAIPLIQEGGRMMIYLPPTLAYGSDPMYNQGQLVIPANSYLIFEIEVTKIQ